MSLTNWVHAATALGTLALAVVTGFMAWSTSRMAKKTAYLAERADIHHRDNLMPVCELCVPLNMLRPVVQWKQDPALHPPSFFEIQVPNNKAQNSVTIQNIGMGPALNVKVILCLSQFPGTQLFAFADDLRPGTACQTPRIFGPPLEGFSDSSWADYITNPEDYKIYIEYTDVFGAPYHTQFNWTPGSPANTFYRGSR